MKHLITVFFLILISAYCFSIPYSVPCPMCEEGFEKHTNQRSWGWRMFGKPHIEKDGKKYAVYHCPHGHKYLVLVDDKK